jgi:hypothetical protein
MTDNKWQKFGVTPPYKSLAGALLFSVFLGPVGLLYANVPGGIIFTLLVFVSISTKHSVAAIVFWLISCVCSAVAVNRYNRNIYKLLG